MSAFRTGLAITRKDLRIEWRHRTAILSAVIFAVLVLLVFVFARETGSVSLPILAPSVLWVTLAFAAIIALNRGFLLERENGALDAILLAPVSRVALFWGKWLANLLFVLAVMGIAFPLWILFFNVTASSALLAVAGVALLTAIGFTAAGTLFSAMTVRTRHAELLLPVLLLPFMLVPVFLASQATARILAERPMAELWGWLRLLMLYDVVFLTLATMLFPAVMDE